MLKVGFIGLGNMGEGMALNLARAGIQLTVRDVRPEPVARLTAAGAAAAVRCDRCAGLVGDRRAREVEPALERELLASTTSRANQCFY